MSEWAHCAAGGLAIVPRAAMASSSRERLVDDIDVNEEAELRLLEGHGRRSPDLWSEACSQAGPAGSTSSRTHTERGNWSSEDTDWSTDDERSEAARSEACHGEDPEMANLDFGSIFDRAAERNRANAADRRNGRPTEWDVDEVEFVQQCLLGKKEQDLSIYFNGVPVWRIKNLKRALGLTNLSTRESAVTLSRDELVERFMSDLDLTVERFCNGVSMRADLAAFAQRLSVCV